MSILFRMFLILICAGNAGSAVYFGMQGDAVRAFIGTAVGVALGLGLMFEAAREREVRP